jgi:hypothetical protein
VDILAALEATTDIPTGRCKVQRVLDDIPDDTPNKDRLVAAIGGEVTAERVAITLGLLGYPIGDSTIKQHRRSTCPCYRGNAA